jgi:hypothetical protein
MGKCNSPIGLNLQLWFRIWVRFQQKRSWLPIHFGANQVGTCLKNGWFRSIKVGTNAWFSTRRRPTNKPSTQRTKRRQKDTEGTVQNPFDKGLEPPLSIVPPRAPNTWLEQAKQPPIGLTIPSPQIPIPISQNRQQKQEHRTPVWKCKQEYEMLHIISALPPCRGSANTPDIIAISAKIRMVQVKTPDIRMRQRIGGFILT